LMQKADAKLFVVNARVSTKVSIDYIEELVEKNAISNAALILNEEKVSRMTYYYSKYGYGYGYGYGYSYGYSYGDNK
jgi:tyrosine-protein kinase Etk/Wzc